MAQFYALRPWGDGLIPLAQVSSELYEHTASILLYTVLDVWPCLRSLDSSIRFKHKSKSFSIDFSTQLFRMPVLTESASTKNGAISAGIVVVSYHSTVDQHREPSAWPIVIFIVQAPRSYTRARHNGLHSGTLGHRAIDAQPSMEFVVKTGSIPAYMSTCTCRERGAACVPTRHVW